MGGDGANLGVTCDVSRGDVGGLGMVRSSRRLGKPGAYFLLK
jgi:hypothetical protein